MTRKKGGGGERDSVVNQINAGGISGDAATMIVYKVMTREMERKKKGLKVGRVGDDIYLRCTE